MPVETAEITRGPISSFLSFNSTLETESAVDIYPQTSGQVVELFVEEGHRVKRGDPLLKIEDRELRVELSDAEINARHLEEGFARLTEIYNRKLLNQQEYDDKKFQLEQARLRVDRARINLDYTIVKAPFDGVLSGREVQVGARVSAGTKLFSLVNLDEIVARVYVPGRYLTQVAERQNAVVTSEFMRDRSFEGRVKRISPVIDPKSGTFKVTVAVNGAPGELAPGMFVNVQVITATRDSALLIPKGAIVYEGGDRYVFTIVDNKAAKRKLAVGFEGLTHLEALTGFDPGTPVITRGQNGLKEGAAVRVVNLPTATPVAAPAGAAAASAQAQTTTTTAASGS